MLERIENALENDLVAIIAKGIAFFLGIVMLLAFVFFVIAIFAVSPWWIIVALLTGLVGSVALSFFVYLIENY